MRFEAPVASRRFSCVLPCGDHWMMKERNHAGSGRRRLSTGWAATSSVSNRRRVFWNTSSTGSSTGPADELAVGWAAIYRSLGQPPPGATAGAEEAEVYLIPDAYTLAGSLVEEGANPDSILSCWSQARENGQRVRAQASACDLDAAQPGLSLDARGEFRPGMGAGARRLGSRSISSTACGCSRAWCTRRCRATMPGAFWNWAASSSGRSTRLHSLRHGSISRIRGGASPRFRGRICFIYAARMKSIAAATR